MNRIRLQRGSSARIPMDEFVSRVLCTNNRLDPLDSPTVARQTWNNVVQIPLLQNLGKQVLLITLYRFWLERFHEVPLENNGTIRDRQDMWRAAPLIKP